MIKDGNANAHVLLSQSFEVIVMRLLSEYMPVPELNVRALPPEHKAPTPNLDSPENLNIQVARKLDEQKSTLANALSNFPAVAHWILVKYEQVLDKEDEEFNQKADLTNLVSEIQKHYQDYLAVLDGLAKPDEIILLAKRRLTNTLQQFPFAFDDLSVLTDMLIFESITRKLVLVTDTYSAKQNDIIKTRLAITKDVGKTEKYLSKIKAIGFNHPSGKLLFQSEDICRYLPDILLAEHSWLSLRQQLASINSKLVLFIANQYKGNFLDFEDLVQEGHTGLLKAVDRFNYRLGFQFSTYAGYWIRQAISRSLSRSERVVRIPCGQVAIINKVFRLKEELTSKLGVEPSMRELADAAELSEDEVSNLLSISQTAVSLEVFDDDDSNETFAPIDFLEQQVYTHSFNQIARTQLEHITRNAVKTLNAREIRIIRSHFGLETGESMTLQEIGENLDLTRERIRQIQAVALSKIRMRYGDQLQSFL